MADTFRSIENPDGSVSLIPLPLIASAARQRINAEYGQLIGGTYGPSTYAETKARRLAEADDLESKGCYVEAGRIRDGYRQWW